MCDDRGVRLGVLADVHGNTAAALLAFGLLAPRVDEFLVAGDAFSDHRFSNEVIELIREHRCRYVVGNHELSLLSPAGRRARESAHVRSGNLGYVADAPTRIRVTIDGRDLLMVHGSPWDLGGEYLQPGHSSFDRVDEIDVDFLVLGHTHLPYIADHGSTVVVNPGSVGRPERPDAPTTASCAIVDTAGGRAADAVELVEFELPIAPGSP